MPTYEYACKSCGENIEVFQSFNARPLKKHAACGGELKKVFHSRGVVFKGSGFYKTDSRVAASNDKSGGNKSSSSENGKSDAKKTATSSSKESSGGSSRESSGSSSKESSGGSSRESSSRSSRD
ncbi:MAG: FmdB family zinc ribbon protein [Acidimicrobiia bacterium]